MFHVIFADQFDKSEIIGDSYNLECLPTIGQKVSIDDFGTFIVVEIILKVSKDTQNSYGVIVKPYKFSIEQPAKVNPTWTLLNNA